MKLAVYNIEGKETGREVEVKQSMFGDNPNDHAIYLEVKHHMANKRQGNHKTKNKWEITVVEILPLVSANFYFTFAKGCTI